MKSKAPQLHLEYRFYKLLGNQGKCESIRLFKTEIQRQLLGVILIKIESKSELFKRYQKFFIWLELSSKLFLNNQSHLQPSRLFLSFVMQAECLQYKIKYIFSPWVLSLVYVWSKGLKYEPPRLFLFCRRYTEGVLLWTMREVQCPRDGTAGSQLRGLIWCLWSKI